MDSYFSQLKTRVKADYEAINKSKLEKYNACKHEKDQFSTYEALESHMYDLLNLFTLNKADFSNNNIENIISDELLNQYEELKENNVTVENEVVYENILLKSFKNIDESKNYFNELRLFIKNNDLNDLSKIIL